MTAAPVSAKELARWRTDGFLVARGLWEREEIAACTERFAAPQSKAGSRGACASNMSSHTCQIWSRVRVAAVCGSSMAAW